MRVQSQLCSVWGAGRGLWPEHRSLDSGFTTATAAQHQIGTCFASACCGQAWQQDPCVLCRLRRALLDAEIDTQRSTVASEAAHKRLADLEAELTKARCAGKLRRFQQHTPCGGRQQPPAVKHFPPLGGSCPHSRLPHVCRRSQLTAAKADAHIQQQRLSAAEATAASTAAQLLEAQANLSKARAEASSLQQDSHAALAAAKLSCSSCAEKAGKVLELQQQLGPTKAMLAEQQQHCASLEAQLEAARSELQGARASLAAAQQAQNQLFYQLHGCADALLLPGAAGQPAGGLLPGSPNRMQMQLMSLAEGQQQGLVQRCSALTLQLQQQEVELASLRQQLLEQQLALSEAQTSCGSAERQLQQAAAELKAAHSAAAEAGAAAAAVQEEVRGLRQQVGALQQALAAQSPELAASRAHVQKLEAQQQVLLGECLEWVWVWMVQPGLLDGPARDVLVLRWTNSPAQRAAAGKHTAQTCTSHKVCAWCVQVTCRRRLTQLPRRPQHTALLPLTQRPSGSSWRTCSRRQRLSAGSGGSGRHKLQACRSRWGTAASWKQSIASTC